MTALVAATAAFVLTHLVSGTPLRAKLVGAMGEWPYRGLYSLAAFVTLGAMIWAYIGLPREPLWPGLRLVPLIAMPFAFILVACGYSRNPTAVGGERLLKSEEPARGVIRITRHPIMWGIMLWAVSHLLARGDTKALVFFGGLFAVALLGSLNMDRRKRANPDFARFAQATSHVPFLAIAQGRNRLDLGEIGWLRPVIGLALFVAFVFLHPWLFGVAAV